MTRRFVFATVLPLLLVASLACRGRPPVHQGPIVLITVDALRADAVGALGGRPGLMPAFDALAAEATWSGRAVSPSSWTVPSMGSIFTGFQPWSVGNWESHVVPESLTTLPEALRQQGYRTAAFRSNHWLDKEYGYAQGFDEFRYIRDGQRAEGYLEGLAGGRDFVWIHILPPHAPYVRRAHLEDRLGDLAKDLPQRVRPLDLEPYFDPAVDPTEETRKAYHALYELNAAYADELLGRMLAALRRSGQWDASLVVVTSDHGEEFSEHGQMAHGGNLGRVLLDVPLVVKLPKAFSRKLALEPAERPGNVRVPATLVEAAGGSLGQGTSPSLFVPVDKGTLSELYLGNGVNRYSLVQGDLQLLWESRFAPTEPEYYRARYEGLGGRPQPPLTEPSDAVFKRLERRFAKALPLTGLPGSPPTLSLWRWNDAGSVRIEDRAAAERLARQLKNLWLAAHGAEALPGRGGERPKLSPEKERELRALGYVAALTPFSIAPTP